MRKVNEVIISDQNKKLSITVDGETLDLANVVSISIEVDCEGIKMNTNKFEILRLGD